MSINRQENLNLKKEPEQTCRQNDQLEHQEGIPKERMMSYWKTVMTKNTGRTF